MHNLPGYANVSFNANAVVIYFIAKPIFIAGAKNMQVITVRRKLFCGLLILIGVLIWIGFHLHPDTETPGSESHKALITSHVTQMPLSTATVAAVVPNIVHYVWIHDQGEPFKFIHWLGFVSAHRRLRPEKILFHCNNEPERKFWWLNITRTYSSVLEIIRIIPPREIYGNEVVREQHQSDIVRLEILAKHGGIYLDLDVLVLQSFYPLRVYNITMGLEYRGDPGRLNNGVILASKSSEFLRMWRQSYSTFRKREWDDHSAIVPYMYYRSHPDLIHVEENSINFPSGKRLDLIYDKMYNHSRNYAIHLWEELHDIDHNPYDIRTMNTTFGKIARSIHYGSEHLLDKADTSGKKPR